MALYCQRNRNGTGAKRNHRSGLWIKTSSALRLYFARSALLTCPAWHSISVQLICSRQLVAVERCRTVVCSRRNSYVVFHWNVVLQRQKKIKTVISDDNIERLKYQCFSYTWGSLRCDKIFPLLCFPLSIIHSCSETGVYVLLVALVFITLTDRADTSNYTVDWDNLLSCIPLTCLFSAPSHPACGAHCNTFSTALFVNLL